MTQRLYKGPSESPAIIKHGATSLRGLGKIWQVRSIFSVHTITNDHQALDLTPTTFPSSLSKRAPLLIPTAVPSASAVAPDSHDPTLPISRSGIIIVSIVVPTAVLSFLALYCCLRRRIKKGRDLGPLMTSGHGSGTSEETGPEARTWRKWSHSGRPASIPSRVDEDVGA